MAVPKKKRIGYRIMNRGSRFQTWHLSMLNLTLSGTPLSHLKGLINISRASINRGAVLTPWLQLLQKFRTRPLSLKGGLVRITPFDREASQFSIKLLAHNFEYKHPHNFNQSKISPAIALLRPLACIVWHPLTKNLTAGQGRYFPVAPTLTALNLQYLKLMSKGSFFTTQLPHKWGCQRTLLLRCWELSPSYFYLAFLKAPLSFSQGLLRLNYPTNLTTPHGPTLKKLWSYIKTNPNEGYWAYCMWLQLIKKWKRWVRFPYQYLLKRNIWRRATQRSLFYKSLDGHRLGFFKPSRVATFSGLRATFFFKGRLKKNTFSTLTNFALLANSVRPLMVRKTLTDSQRVPALKTRPKLTKSKTLTLLRVMLSSLKIWFRTPFSR